MISCYHNDQLAEHFKIDKIQELISRKYYWPSLKKDIETYIWECNVCLASKAARHKLYVDLQSFFVLTQQWKNLLIDFVTGLPLFADWKGDNYNLIFVIVN